MLSGPAREHVSLGFAVRKAVVDDRHGHGIGFWTAKRGESLVSRRAGGSLLSDVAALIV
jgi:hypothetical protein